MRNQVDCQELRDARLLPALDHPPRVALPLYPFDRQRFAPVVAAPSVVPAGSSAIGHLSWQPALDATFEVALDMHQQPWLADHVIHGQVLVPGAYFFALPFQCSVLADAPNLLVKRIRLQRPSIVDPTCEAHRLAVRLCRSPG